MRYYSIRSVFGGALIFALLTAILVLREHVLLPGYDEWDTVAEFQALLAGQFGFLDLFNQHNEHRLFFPRLIFFADFLAFEGRGYLSVAATLLTQAAHALLLIHIQRAAIRDSTARILFPAVTLVCLFSLGQSGNFIWGFQVQFVGVYAAATLAVWSFARALPDLPNGPPLYRRLVLPAFAITLATFTMANGIIVGPTCVILGLIVGARWTIIGATAAVTLLLAAFYYHGFESPDQQSVFAAVGSHSLTLLRYTVTYLGNITGNNVRVAGTLGSLGLASSAASFAAVLWDRGRHRPRLVLFGIGAFIVATALATAFGRSVLGVSQATEVRYNTPTFIFWVVELSFWWSLLAERRSARWVIVVLTVVVVGCAIHGEVSGATDVRRQARRSREAGDSLLSATFDPQAFSYDNEDPPNIQHAAAFLRERRLSIFSTDDSLLLGRSLDQAGTLLPEDACRGGIDKVLADRTLGSAMLRVTGEAMRSGSRGGVDRIYIVDGAHHIVGYASGNLPDSVHRLWQGYAAGQPGTTIDAYAQLDAGHLCRLGSLPVPPTALSEAR